jgi:putative protease
MDNGYILSPKDLCTINFLDKILEAGVKVLKIEGRGRSADYVKTVTSCYREAADAWQSGSYSPQKADEWMQKLKTVYNRGFWDGYYLGKTIIEWTESYGSQASRTKVYVGKVLNYFSRIGVAEILMEANSIGVGDEYILTGETSGVVDGCIGEMRLDDRNSIQKAEKGQVFSIAVSKTVRRGDKLYRLMVS